MQCQGQSEAFEAYFEGNISAQNHPKSTIARPSRKSHGRWYQAPIIMTTKPANLTPSMVRVIFFARYEPIGEALYGSRSAYRISSQEAMIAGAKVATRAWIGRCRQRR